MQAGGWLGALMRLRRFALIALTFCTLFGNATPAFTAPGKDAPMRFAVVRGDPGGCDPICPEWISAEGKIVGDTAAKFRKFLKKLGDRQLPLVIHSPGGDVQNALAMGRLIREKKLDVAVGRTAFSSCSPETKGCKGGYTGWALPIGALCNSACPLVLAGGTQRLVGKAALGVHQITTTTVREKDRNALRSRQEGCDQESRAARAERHQHHDKNEQGTAAATDPVSRGDGHIHGPDGAHRNDTRRANPPSYATRIDRLQADDGPLGCVGSCRTDLVREIAPAGTLQSGGITAATSHCPLRS